MLLVVQQNLRLVGNMTRMASSAAAEEGACDTTSSWPPLPMLQNLFNGSREGADDNQPKRLVVVATNAAYVYFADNFASSLLRLNVTNFVLVPLDAKAFSLLQPAYPMRTLPPPPAAADSLVVQKAAVYGTTAFQALTSSRPTFLRYFIEKNITVFYNDIDIVWKRNAWSELDQLDHAGTKVKIWEDGDTELCSCLLYLPPTDFTLKFLLEWEHEIRSHGHNNDQPALGAAAVTLGIDRLWRSKEDSHEVQIVSHSDEFPTGRDYFQLGSNRSRAVIIHNNWILGQNDKRERFQKYGLWNLSGRLSPEIVAPPASPMRAAVFRNWTVKSNTNREVLATKVGQQLSVLLPINEKSIG